MAEEIKCVSTPKKYSGESLTAKMEKNDCVVRAIASGFDVSYDKAHAFVAETFNRKPKQGTYIMKMKNLSEAFGKKIVEMGEIIPEIDPYRKSFRRWYRKRGKMSWGKYTTERFIEAFPKGTYFIVVRQHTFTIKNGVVYGNDEDATKLKVRIEQAFKIG